MAAWFLTFLLFVGFTVLSELLRPKAKFGAPTASSLGDFRLPTAQEGRAIPILFGTCKVSGPNVVWYGDLVVQAIKKKVKTGLFSSEKVTLGYRYFIGAQLVLCHGPVDAVTAVRFDDRPVTPGVIVIHALNDGIAFGTGTNDTTVYTAHIAHGNYEELPALAAAAQSAMRSTHGSNWRVVYGFHVGASVSDQFTWDVIDTTNATTGRKTATLPAAEYDGVGFAAALQAAMNAEEATFGGGARVAFAVSFTGSKITISAASARSGYKAWLVVGNTTDHNVDRSLLPNIGGRLGFDTTVPLTRGLGNAGRSLPATYTPPGDCGEARFLFAYPAINGKLYHAHASFTAANVLGVDRTPRTGTQSIAPDRTYGGSWGVFGFSGEDSIARSMLAGNLDATAGIGRDFGTDLCIGYGTNLKGGDAEDPGNLGTWDVYVKLYRGETDSGGTVDCTVTLYAGVDPDTYPDGGGSGGTNIASQVFTATYQTWTEHALTLSDAQKTAFRSAGGFSTGYRIELVGNSGGAGNCNNKSLHATALRFRLPTPDWRTLRHHRAYREATLPGLKFTDSTDVTTIDIRQPALFGGDEREGGVEGRIDFYKGTLTQSANDYLEGVLGVDLPAYRGICYAVLRRLYIGTSPYLKAIAFDVRRCPNTLGLTGGRENLNGDANPAAMLYEILTNTRWGVGLASGQVDTASFVAAGNLLAAESFGLSMLVDRSSGARDLIGEILRHVDGVIYTDPATGLVQLTLARANYGPADPLRLDVDNLASCKLSRPSWEDTKNVVKVRYIDRSSNYLERIAQAQDLANVEVRGGDLSEEDFDFRGISNGTLAQIVAARTLRLVSYPLAVLELEVNRAAWQVRPGHLVRVTWAPLGIVDMACRVTRISSGTLQDGTIRVDAVEDVFGVESTGYVAVGGTGWNDPILEPTNLDAAALLECPYALVVGASRLVLTLAAQASQAQAGYQVWADTAGGSRYALVAEVREFTPSATLSASVGYTETTLVVSAGAGVAQLESLSDADFAGGRNVVLIDAELVAWQFVSLNADGTYTLAGCVRGVADTVPARHTAGARAWFVTDGAGFTSAAPYDSDVTIAARLLPFTPVGIQPLEDATDVTITTNSRAARPYVPRDVKIEGFAYPVFVTYANPTVEWSHRNRLAEWSWADGGKTATVEPGCTYTLKFYGDDGALKKTYSGLTGTSQSWTTEVADTGRRNESVRVTLEAVVAGVSSFQVFDLTVFRSIADSVGPREVAVGGRPRKRRRVVRVKDATEVDG